MRNGREDKTFLTRTEMPLDQACCQWRQSSPCHIGSPPIRGRGLASNKDTRALNKILYTFYLTFTFQAWSGMRNVFFFQLFTKINSLFWFLVLVQNKKYTLPDALSEKWKCLNTSENYWDFSSTNTKRNFSSFLDDPFVSFFTRKNEWGREVVKGSHACSVNCSPWSQTQNFWIELWELLLPW